MLSSLRMGLVICLLVCASPALATTYYVATTGSDSNNGTAVGTPFLTIQKCIDTVSAGDTCTVADGTYTDNDGNGIVGYIRATNAHGTAGSPITLKSTNPNGAIVTIPSLNALNAGFYLTRNYWIIEGFAITGGASTGTSASHHGIAVYSGSTGAVIRKNKIHNVARTVCSSSSLGFTGIYVDNATSLTIEDNLIHTIGRLRGSSGNSESGCTLTAGNGGLDQNDHGLYIKTTTSLIIRRNLIYDANRGFAVQFYGGTTTSATMVHNTLAADSPTGLPDGQVMLASAWAGASSIKNNIFYDPESAPFTTYNISGAGTISIDYNLTDNADANLFHTAVPSQATVGANNLVNTSPGFVNVACTQADGGCEAVNFNLAAGSAAIDAGTSVCTTSNGSACDIGAYETIIHSTCSVEDGDASTLRITFANNAHPPLLPASGIAFGTNAFTARKAGANNVVTAATRVGDNRIDLTLTDAIVNGNAVDYSYSTTSGNVTDSALIGGTLTQRLNSITNQSCTNNVGAAASHVFTQAAFEFHSLRGSESAPVGTPYANAPENSNIKVRVGGSVRLRIAVTCTTADCPPTGFYPRYSKNAGAYSTVVPDLFAADNIGFCGTSPDVDIPTSGTATTDQLSTAGTFVAGALVRTSNAIPTVDLGLNNKTELEYCFSFDTDEPITDPPPTYDIRLYEQDGTPLGAYTVTPRMTLMSPQAGMGF